MGALSVFYAALGHLALLAAILWTMLFAGDGGSIAMMDAGSVESSLHAALIDGALLASLALLYELVRRGTFKDSPMPIVPKHLERATHTWAASIAVGVVLYAWHPLPQPVWNVSGMPAVILSALFYVGWTLVLIGTFLTNDLELFDSPVEQRVGEDARRSAAGSTTGFFAWMRRPTHVGVLMGLWSTSLMSVGHLLLAAAATAYVIFAAARLRDPFRARSKLQYDVPVRRDAEDLVGIAKPTHRA